MEELSLAEQVMLVAFDPRQGKPATKPSYSLPHGLAGAVVMDLLLRHYVQVVEGNVSTGEAASGDPILEAALDMMRRDSKPRSIRRWMRRLAGQSFGLSQRLLLDMVESGAS